MTDDNYDACIDKIKKMFSSPRREEILKVFEEDAIKNPDTHNERLRKFIKICEEYEGSAKYFEIFLNP